MQRQWSKCFLNMVVLALMLAIRSTWAQEAETPSKATLTQKVRVAVLNFDASLPQYVQIAEAARDAVNEFLGRYGNTFEVYERAALARLLEEAGLSAVGIVEASTAMQIGKLVGVQLVVMGTVRSVSVNPSREESVAGFPVLIKGDVSVRLNCRVVSAEDGRILYQAETLGAAEGDDLNALFIATRRAASEFVSSMMSQDMTASVVNVDVEAGYFVINRGADHGITQEMEFVVEKPGKIIKDVDGNVLEQIWDEVCIARPVPRGVSGKITRLCPVSAGRGGLLRGSSWKFDKGKLKQVEVGYRVRPTKSK